MALSYLHVDNIWFKVLKNVIGVGIGIYYGVKAYHKYDKDSREKYLEISKKFLTDYQKKLNEWYKQVIKYCQGEFEANN